VPDGNQTMRAGLEVVPDHCMEPSEIVTGHGGIHVMFGVVIHLPIEKAHRRKLTEAFKQRFCQASLKDLPLKMRKQFLTFRRESQP